MDCQRIAQQASKVATLIFVFAFSIIALVHAKAAMAQVPNQTASAVLEQSRKYQLQFRTGDMSVIQPWVALLEQATAAAAAAGLVTGAAVPDGLRTSRTSAPGR